MAEITVGQKLWEVSSPEHAKAEAIITKITARYIWLDRYPNRIDRITMRWPGSPPDYLGRLWVTKEDGEAAYHAAHAWEGLSRAIYLQHSICPDGVTANDIAQACKLLRLDDAG